LIPSHPCEAWLTRAGLFLGQCDVGLKNDDSCTNSLRVFICKTARETKARDFPVPHRYAVNRAANPDAWTPELPFDLDL
jgi:hypothetical protein